MTSLSPTPKLQFFDANGDPLAGGLLYTYEAGSTTPLVTYTDSTGVSANTNPIVLDSRGEANVWLEGEIYKVALYSATNVLIWTVDNVASALALLATPGGSALVGYLPAGTGAVATTVQAKLRQTVSVKDFGAVGDSVTDDTTAIQNAIDHASTVNKAVLFPEGQYAITQIDTKGYTCTWYFEEAELLAISLASTTCAVRVRSFNSKFYGMKVNLNNKLNYNCAIWWYDAAVPSQYNSFFGLTIMQAWRGLVYGEFPGSTSTSLAQSENSVFGFQCYGVWQPLIMNHANGVLVFSGGQFVSSNDTWGGAFDNTNNFAFIAYAGCLTLEGCEVQNSIAATTSYGAIIQGGEVYLNGCITEFDVPFQLSGLLTINGGRVINTRSDTDMFYIGSTANAGTKLKVNNCYIYRAANVGSFSARYLVNNDGSSQNIQIMFNDCDIIEWASFVSLVRSNNQSSSFNNCRWFPDGTQDAFYGVYNLDTVGQNIIDLPAIDTRGYTTDGFYVSQASGTSTMTLSADVPNSSFVNSISVNSTNTGGAFTADGTSLTTLKATAFRTVATDKFLIEAWIKYVSGGSDNARLGVVCYDSSGALLGSAFIQVDNNTAAVSSAWNYVRGVLTIPTGSTAAYVGFGAYSGATEVRFCGVKVRRSNWNMV